MKLLGKGDLKVCRLRHQGSNHYFITPNEMRIVMNEVGEVAYCLYSYYRTGFFNESDDFEDEVVANVIGWPAYKVKRYRLVLEEKKAFCKIRYGTKNEGMTKVLIGVDTIALHEAGLPPDILDGKAFNKLKKKFKVESTSELVEVATAMAKEYEQNPDLYK